MNTVICDEGDCTRDAYWVLTIGTSTRRVCGRHHPTAIKDLKFLHPGERVEVRSGTSAVLTSLSQDQGRR